MNWRLEAKTKVSMTALSIEDCEREVTLAEGEEDPRSDLSPLIVESVAMLSENIAQPEDEVLVSIERHETLSGDGFRTAHIQVTISRVDPAAAAT